jgi:hypothetical protein
MSETEKSPLEKIFDRINILTGLITGVIAAVTVLSVPANLITIALVIAVVITILAIFLKKLSVGTAVLAWLSASLGIVLVYFWIRSLTTVVTGNVIYPNSTPVPQLQLILVDSSGVDHGDETDTDGVFNIPDIGPRGHFKIMINDKQVFGGKLSSFWMLRFLEQTVDVGTLVYDPPPTPTPTPTSTQTPTDTPTATNTPTASITPTMAATNASPMSTPQILSFEDFERTIEGWGDKPSGISLRPETVMQRCGTGAHSGSCWLEYTPTKFVNNRDAYLAREGTNLETQAVITMFVKVPAGTDLCTPTACSTARIIVWDRDYRSHESDFVELNDPGEWVKVEFDLSGETFSFPYQFIGLHFYINTDYTGPFYVDAVTVTKP